MMPSPRPGAVALVASSLAMLFSLGALAEPLDKESCASLKVERSKLLTGEIKAALDRGPDWVKDHLESGLLEQVRRFLMVEETLAFRCRTNAVAIPKPKPVPLPDRKPSLPSVETAAAEPAQATEQPEQSALSALMPERNPSRRPSESLDAEAPKTVDAQTRHAVADADEPGARGLTRAGPSQTVAGSDKTAPSQVKATTQ